MILSVDPGLRGCGVALWGDGALVGAGYVRGPTAGRGPAAWVEMARCVAEWVGRDGARLVVEYPQVYVRARSKGDPNDLIQLAGVVGAISARFPAWPVGYLPAQWKGQLSKEICWARAERDLEVHELNRVKWPAKSLRHNVEDALALGLYHLKATGAR